MRMNNIDRVVASHMFKLVERSLIDPDEFTMISTRTLFRNDEPVLYYKHWGTDHLEEPDRDSEEIQAFMSFDGFVNTEEGKYATFQVLDMLFEETSMSEENIPSGLETLNSVPREVFEPMMINGWTRPRFGC